MRKEIVIEDLAICAYDALKALNDYHLTSATQKTTNGSMLVEVKYGTIGEGANKVPALCFTLFNKSGKMVACHKEGQLDAIAYGTGFILKMAKEWANTLV